MVFCRHAHANLFILRKNSSFTGHLVILQDLRYFKSKKTNRGLLQEGWINNQDPIMCSYKLVTVKFEVWGLQTRVEQFVHKVGM